jgi:mutual gliding-motility protein MglA
MSLINYAGREINCKIVYYGPALSGKTTNIQQIYDRIRPESRGRLISATTDAERTLFFDFLAVELGTIRGFQTRFHLYSVPGQLYYNTSRRLLLKGVDGVVFVADSRVEAMESNVASLANLQTNLAEHGTDLTRTPVVLQYNKRDVPTAVPIEEMRAQLNAEALEEYEAIAAQGVGVFETLKGISRHILRSLA